MEGPEKRLGAACPNGGNFFVCGGKPHRFVGCCGTNPCDTENGNCPDDKLETMTFNKTAYDKILPQACLGSGSIRPLWYACAYSVPPFMGCCAENPCRPEGCSPKALRQAMLSNDTEAAAVFLPMPVSSSTQSSASMSRATTTSSSLAEASTHAATATPAAIDVPVDSHREVSKGAVAGIAVGSTVGAIILLGLLVFWFKRFSRLSRQRSQAGIDRHTGGQLYHQEQNFGTGPQSITPHPLGESYRDMRSPIYPLSAGYQPAHCIHTPVQAVELSAVELPATTNEDKGVISRAATLEESPCLGKEKEYEASGMTAPLRPRQSRPFELEDPSTQHPDTERTQ